MRKHKVQGQQGFSLLEIIIVIALIGVIATFVINSVVGVQKGALLDAAELSMGNIEQQLQLYKLTNYNYPKALKDLIEAPPEAKKWRGPYISEDKLRDPWGTDLQYSVDGAKFKLVSAGPDQQMGTSDDISYPK